MIQKPSPSASPMTRLSLLILATTFALGSALTPIASNAQPLPQSQTIQGGVNQSQLQGQGNASPWQLSGQADGSENVLIILDGSQSMAEKLPSGESKMAAAKRAILDLVRSLPPSVRVGLRVYGTSNNPFTTCRATRLMVPLGTQNRNTISSSLISVYPTGATPISFSLKTAVQQDFIGVGGKKTIILVSDGMETCDADPCQTSVDFVRAGVNVKINVVGLGIKDLAATKQLECVALSTFGKYYSANTAADLARSMQRSADVQTSVQGQILLPNSSGNRSW